jgi:phosphoribosylamine--glycine ligase
MRVLLIGGGGREHAMAWKIAQSPELEELICAPGNAGIALEPKTTCVPVGAEDLDGLLTLARERKPDLVVVGPEAPLVLGIVEKMSELGVLVVGPRKEAAMLEGSKVFAKQVMKRHGIPTADFEVFEDANKAIEYARSLGRCVVKADGLAAGKGVLMCQNAQEAEQAISKVIVDRAFGDAGRRAVVEELLEGEEASCIALTDGKEILLMASSQDHKRALDGDKGLNTGGMGAYSPAPVLDEKLQAQVKDGILKATVAGMASEGIEFRGIIYAGLMMTAKGPQVLEFNVRFGDPETQPLLARLRSDLIPALKASAEGNLAQMKLEWDPRPSVCVVMAAGGYPESYQKGKVITGLDQAAGMEDVVVFHAGTKKEGEAVVTSGGRVLGVTALGKDIRGAVDRAYQAVEVIKFDQAHYRKDIAYRALERKP